MGQAVFVFGAAGSGKTTFCRNIKEFVSSKRAIKLVNLDPAQENGADYDIDLCNHITVNEVMSEMDYGPNGALFYALNEMAENLEELQLEDLENDFFVFDCPGQIELFLHSDILQELIKNVKSNSKVAIVYLIDSCNFLNNQKLLYTLLCATISTYRFNLPVLNIISKADLLEEEKLEQILSGEYLFQEENTENKNGKFLQCMTEYISNNGMIDFLPLDWKEDNTVENILLFLDNVLQRYDDEEPKESRYEE